MTTRHDAYDFNPNSLEKPYGVTDPDLQQVVLAEDARCLRMLAALIYKPGNATRRKMEVIARAEEAELRSRRSETLAAGDLQAA